MSVVSSNKDIAFAVQLRLLSLRAPLREILATSPRDLINMTTDNDSSLLNRYKNFIEDYTMTNWDWCPLKPKVPHLAPGQVRLEYKVSHQFP